MSAAQAQSPVLGQPLLALYERMCVVRAVEEVVAEAYSQGLVRGLLHLSTGGEAVSVGIASVLGPNDRLYSTHRPHGHFVACGVEPHALLAELAGKETGLCRGRGGSMHLMSDQAVMATGVVGGTLPIAVGHALAVGAGNAVVALFGDGAAQTGVFHESLNLAALWGAPVLFVCENNGWAEFTSRDEHTNVETVAEYGALHGIRSRIVDGVDIESVIEGARDLLGDVRSGDGPALLECNITRIRSHYEGDARRLAGSEDERGDPLARLRNMLREDGAVQAELDSIWESAYKQAKSDLDRALADPPPNIADERDMVFRRPLS